MIILVEMELTFMKRKHRRKRYNGQKRVIVLSLLFITIFLNIGYAAFSTNINLSAKGNIKDKSRVIQSFNNKTGHDFHTEFYENNIITITFLDSAVVPNNAIEAWDVSESKEQGVMAYILESTTETGKYDLYIGAKNGVIANPDSRSLFYKFINVKTINFGKNFDTSNVLYFNAMFGCMSSLTELDLKEFNTQNALDMGSMFSMWDNQNAKRVSSALTHIEFGENFITKNVTNMNSMFYGLENLITINLNTFDTRNVTDMYHMFQGNYKLSELNLCTFNTSKVTNMKGMLSALYSVSKVYVGPKWDTSNADTSKIFDGSAVSSVTTSKCPA